MFCVGGTSGYSRKDYIHALDELGRRYNPRQFNIQLQNFGQFEGKGEEGNTIWVGVKNSLPLYELKRNLEQTIKSLNVHIEPSQFKGYTPHITMGYNVVVKDDFELFFEDDEEITIKSLSLWDSFKAKNQDKESHIYNKIHELFFK
ncbi:RNA 2',3'-cyclic phosphodiesterase [compost metagenome]